MAKIHYLFFIYLFLLLNSVESDPRQQFGFSTQSLPIYSKTEAWRRPKAAAVVQSGTTDSPVQRRKSRENPETVLIRTLFEEYDDVARPVLNMSKSVNVQFGYRLLSIQLNEVDQLLTSFVWLPHRWRDERLTWDPADYGDIDFVIIPNRMLWLPDTFLYQSSDDSGYVTSFDRVPVHYDGLLEWWPSATLLSPCIIDVTFFPFDYQECNLTIGPWGYHSDQVNYTIMDTVANLDRYTVSGAWELLSTNIHREIQFYPDLNMSYTLIDISIKLRRKALYYWLNIILPCILLNALGIGLFILPADSGEKVSFGLGILLTVFVFAILVNENIPKTSDYTPVMGIYLVIIMGMISSSLILAIIIENLHHRRPKLTAVPKWVRVLFLEKLAKVLGIKLPQLPLFTALTMQGITPKKKKKMKIMRRWRKLNDELTGNKDEIAKLNIEAEEPTNSLQNEAANAGEVNEHHCQQTENRNSDGEVADAPKQTEEERLFEAYKNMPFDEKDNDEWILIALVMDNLLGWIFFALLVMTTSMVLVIVPVHQTLRHD